MLIPLYLVALIAAGTAARHVARTFPHDTIEVRQLAGFVVFVAQIVASVLAAGFVVRDLHAMVLFSIGVLLAVVVIRAVPADRRVVAPPAPPSAASRELGAVGWLVAFAVALYGGATIIAVLLPPRGFDSMWYHLTSVVHWLDAGRIERASYSPIIGRYPADVELFWLHGARFVDSMRMAVVSNVVLTLLLAVAVRAMARVLGLSPRRSLLCGTVVVLTPIVVAQSLANYVDMPLLAFEVAAGVFAATIVRSLSVRDRAGVRGSLVLCATSAGLAVGSKYSALVPTVVLLVVLVALVVRARLRPGWPAWSVAVLLFAGLGLPWYIRNLVAESDPVAPFAVEVAGLEIFDGPADADEWTTPAPVAPDAPKPVQFVRSLVDDARRLVVPRAVSEEERRGGFGPLLPLVGLPALALVVARTFRRRTDVLVRALPFGYLAVLTFAQPYWWWTRFTIPLVVAGTIATVGAFPAQPTALLRRAGHVWCVAAAGIALLGVMRIGFPDEQWSGRPDAALGLVVDEGGLVDFDRVMPEQQSLLTAQPRLVAIDEEFADATRSTGVVLSPAAGADLDRRLMGMPSLDDAGLEAWLAAHRPGAIMVRPGGVLERQLDGRGDYVRGTPTVHAEVFVRRDG